MKRQYYPSNGTEGAMFEAQYCDRCYKHRQCSILLNAVVGNQPKQWVYENDDPVCTSFCASRPKRKVTGGLFA